MDGTVDSLSCHTRYTSWSLPPTKKSRYEVCMYIMLCCMINNLLIANSFQKFISDKRRTNFSM